MEAYKIEAIEELNAQILEKEQELTALRMQLAELTGVSLEPESLTQRRKRSPKVKDIAGKDDAPTVVAEGVASAPTDPVAE